MTSFAIIGFGEVGSRFACDLRAKGAERIYAYDIDPSARDIAAATGYVSVCQTAAFAAALADVIFVSVTAGSAIDAVKATSRGLVTNSFVIDINSVSPERKIQAAQIVTSQGGRYVEAAVMASIGPLGLASPMLLGGPDARDWMALIEPFGMQLKFFGDEIGGASSVKMCRSVFIKGLEALAMESMLSARYFGVEEQVLASLTDTLPHQDWPTLARYMIMRALIHGKRRSEEMLEVAETARQAGIEPMLSTAIAKRQAWAATKGLGLELASLPGLGPLLDSIIQSGKD